jgi:hypothetical protein
MPLKVAVPLAVEVIVCVFDGDLDLRANSCVPANKEMHMLIRQSVNTTRELQSLDGKCELVFITWDFLGRGWDLMMVKNRRPGGEGARQISGYWPRPPRQSSGGDNERTMSHGNWICLPSSSPRTTPSFQKT